VVGTWRTQLSAALLNYSIAYKHDETKVPGHDERVVCIAQLIDAENLAPKHRVVFNGNWSLGKLSFNVRESYHTNFTSAQDHGQTNGIANQVFGASSPPI
jgi:iron complex outermembrane receptor protein